MPKILSCPHCNKKFGSSTYVMYFHIIEECLEYKKTLIKNISIKL